MATEASVVTEVPVVTEAPTEQPEQSGVPLIARELSASEFKKKYGFTRQGDSEPKPFLARLHAASQGWGRVGVIIQGIIFNKALNNLGARRDNQESPENF